VTDSDPRAAALIANAVADELIRQSPASMQGESDQQEFIEKQLSDLKTKIGAEPTFSMLGSKERCASPTMTKVLARYIVGIARSYRG